MHEAGSVKPRISHRPGAQVLNACRRSDLTVDSRRNVETAFSVQVGMKVQ